MRITANISKIDSIVMSNFILKHYGPMSHLKLQKLLFYCDAYHMAYFGEELITDEFEAWAHGPVSRRVYNSLKDKSILYSDLAFDNCSGNPDVEFEGLMSEQRDLIKDILDGLSTWTGLQLESATHKEVPWIEARKGYDRGAKCSERISKQTTKDFYYKEMYA